MPTFHLTTHWTIHNTPERIWEYLQNVERYPEWWPGFLGARVVEKGGSDGLGASVECRVRGTLPYVFKFRTTVLEIERPRLLRLRAVGGLEGMGVWTLEPNGPATHVTYQWDIQATNPILNIMAAFPPAKSFLAGSHDRVMAEGGRNLERLLASR